METLFNILLGAVTIAFAGAICFFLFLLCKSSYDQYLETRK